LSEGSRVANSLARRKASGGGPKITAGKKTALARAGKRGRLDRKNPADRDLRHWEQHRHREKRSTWGRIKGKRNLAEKLPKSKDSKSAE